MNTFLTQIAHRLRLRHALARVGTALVVGSAIAALWLLVTTWVPMPHSKIIAMAVLVASSLSALAQFIFTSYTRADAAQVTDLVLDTRSLFVTANELQHTTPDHECVRRADQVAANTRIAQVVPIRLRRTGGALALTLAVAIAIPLAPCALLPPPTNSESRLLAADHVEAAADRIEKSKSKKDLERAQRLHRLARRLRSEDIDTRTAMEELGELKRQLRAESRTEELRAARASRSAAHSLGKSDLTRQLGRALGQSRASAQKTVTDKVTDALRELATLDRDSRQEAAESLERAAGRARGDGNSELAKALEAAAQAVRNGNTDQVDAAAQHLAETMAQARSTSDLARQLTNDLDRAQAALDGRTPKTTAEGEAAITPASRQWDETTLRPGSRSAGTDHTDQEGATADNAGEHQDSDRFDERDPDPWREDYRELYEAALLNSDGLIPTEVKGERRNEGKVQVVQGGEQAPRADRARDAIAKLPVRYADEARKAVGSEEVPPGYREAVRAYFDAQK